MNISEKFCLKWNDFHKNLINSFKALRDDTDFADVTLACEGGHQINAHKVILASSSPVFQTLLKRNKHQHPLLYMRGTKSEDLVAILDYLYHGEVNIYQENLDNFLGLADELKIKGLAGTQEEEKHKTSLAIPKSMPKTKSDTKTEPLYANNPITLDKPILKSDPFIQQTYAATDETNSKTATMACNATVATINNSSDLQELDTQIKSMMVKTQNTLPNSSQKAYMYVCQVCGKESSYRNIKDHIEAHHLEGVSLPCNLCDKTFRSRNALRMHKSKNHNYMN